MVDDRPNAVRYPESQEGVERDPRELPLRDEKPYHLAEEERVPFRLLVHGCDETLFRLHPDAFSDEGGHLAPVQARGRACASGQSRKLGERRRKRIVERGIDVAVGAEEHEPRVGELTGKELQEEE